MRWLGVLLLNACCPLAPALDAGTGLSSAFGCDGAVVDAATPAPFFGFGRNKLLPFGDSLTYGYYGPTAASLGGYRTKLRALLVADGRHVDFVGSQHSGPPELMGDLANEGHPGWTTSQLDAIVDATIAEYQPDTVTLLASTNDVRLGVANIPASLSSLIAHMRDRCGCEVFVGTIPPCKGFEAGVAAVNAALPAVVATLGPRVHLVQAGSLLSESDLSSDGVHPIQDGYDKMAVGWYEAIK